MRVTNNMMTNMLLHNLNRNMFNMARLQEQGTDGKRVHRPSDDPIGISKILKFRTDLGELDQYQANIRDVLSWYQVSESAISDLGSIIGRAKELAVQASNGTYDTNDLQKIRQEIEQLKDHMVNTGNFNYAGRYVFSGYQNDKPLFARKMIDGRERVIYNIDITDRDKARPQETEYLIGQAEQIEVSTNGIDVFGITAAGNAYLEMMTDGSGSEFGEGLFALQGRFDPNEDYTTTNLDITLTDNSTTPPTIQVYDVDKTLLTGDKTPIDKALILERYRQAKLQGGTTEKLDDVADIYFDNHDNLVIKTKEQNQTLTSTCRKLKFVETTVGISSKKSQLVGTFKIDGPGSDYRKSNIVYNIGGTNYSVDTSELTGNGFELKRAKVLDKIRNADDGAGHKLEEVADVFFDQNGNLVVKEKQYGDRTISVTISDINPADPPAVAPEYNPALKRGNDKVEASADYADFFFNDEYIASHEEELKNNAIFVTHNGVRHKIELDKYAAIVTVDQYKDALQEAINKTIGDNKVVVDLKDSNYVGKRSLTFTTINSKDGEKPEIYVEPVVSNKSSLIADFEQFIEDLEKNDKAGIDSFMDKLDGHLDRVLSVRADIGAKTNRMELALERTQDNNLSFTKALSNVEDVDLSKTIMLLKNFENVYRASLSMGTKIIQPSLVDFLR